MVQDHEVNESCKTEHARFNKHIDDMTNPKDGVIRCIYKTISTKFEEATKMSDSKVGWKAFGVFVSLLVLIATAGVTYTNIVSSEHDRLATKVEMERADKDLKEQIKEVKVSVDRINTKLDDVKNDIIKAIRKQ